MIEAFGQFGIHGLFDFRKAMVSAALPDFQDALEKSARETFGDVTIGYKIDDPDAGLFGRMRRASLCLVDGWDALHSRWPVSHHFLIRKKQTTFLERIFGGK